MQLHYGATPKLEYCDFLLPHFVAHFLRERSHGVAQPIKSNQQRPSLGVIGMNQISSVVSNFFVFFAFLHSSFDRNHATRNTVLRLYS